MSEYRLEMCDVVKTFPGVKALNHAQLKLKPGTVHALMGENGAGDSFFPVTKKALPLPAKAPMSIRVP